MAHFGEELGRLMEAKHLNQEMLAQAVGVTPRNISRWLEAAEFPRNPRNYRALAAALEMSPEQLDARWKTQPPPAAVDPAAVETQEEPMSLDAIVRTFKSLSPQDQQGLLAHLSALAVAGAPVQNPLSANPARTPRRTG